MRKHDCRGQNAESNAESHAESNSESNAESNGGGGACFDHADRNHLPFTESCDPMMEVATQFSTCFPDLAAVLLP